MNLNADTYTSPSFPKRRIVEYIFPLPRNAFPREVTGVKTDFFFREKVLLSEIVGKKDRVEQLSNRAERLSSRAKRGKTAKRS